MLIILAFFLPPLALLLAGMPFQAIVNFILWVFSILGLIFFWPGFFLWVVCVVHAILMIQKRRADQRAQKIVDAIERQDEPPGR